MCACVCARALCYVCGHAYSTHAPACTSNTHKHTHTHTHTHTHARTHARTGWTKTRVARWIARSLSRACNSYMWTSQRCRYTRARTLTRLRELSHARTRTHTHAHARTLHSDGTATQIRQIFKAAAGSNNEISIDEFIRRFAPPEVHIHIHTSMHACIHTYIHTHIHTHTHTHTHIREREERDRKREKANYHRMHTLTFGGFRCRRQLARSQ